MMKLNTIEELEIRKLLQEMNSAQRSPHAREAKLRKAAKELEDLVNTGDFDQAEATRILNVYEAAYIPNEGELVETFIRRLLNILIP